MTDRTILRELLTEAAQQFRMYEANHRAKNTVDATAKAVVNADFATKIERALAQSVTGDEQQTLLMHATNTAMEQQQQEILRLTQRESELLEASTRNLLRARKAEGLFQLDAVEVIAQIAHAVNKAWCELQGDHSQKPWSEAPDWQKESAINGVKFHAENPEAGDAASHNNWMTEKKALGWVYGEVKDETLRTHPSLVPFEQLSAAEQFKDRLFRTVVHGAVGN